MQTNLVDDDLCQIARASDEYTLQVAAGASGAVEEPLNQDPAADGERGGQQVLEDQEPPRHVPAGHPHELRCLARYDGNGLLRPEEQRNECRDENHAERERARHVDVVLDAGVGAAHAVQTRGRQGQRQHEQRRSQNVLGVREQRRHVFRPALNDRYGNLGHEPEPVREQESHRDGDHIGDPERDGLLRSLPADQLFPPLAARPAPVSARARRHLSTKLPMRRSNSAME